MSNMPVTRREAMSATIVGPSFLAAGAARGMARRERRPNILFILADDLGCADLSSYGRRGFKTPNIDALAAAGVRFTQAYANSAVCSATRTALITGRYQYRLPVGLEEPLTFNPVGLPPQHPTVPSLLRRAGYATALIGKWHLGGLPDFGPLQSGYDHFWGFRSGSVDYFMHRSFGDPDLWDGDTPIEQAGDLTDLLAERAITTLGQFARSDRPFLLSLHFSAPHLPWEGSEDERTSRRLAAPPVPAARLNFGGGAQASNAAMVTRLDRQVGRVLGALRRMGLERDTIVVFTSDNGGERFSDTGPFTGRKTELLEGGLRIPAIVRWPASVRPGTVSDAQIMSMDWLPTLLAAAGATPEARHPSDGIDLAPALHGGTLPKRTLFWRYEYLGQQACRDGDMKYLKIADRSFLFDVVADPMERANLKTLQHARFAELEARYAAWNATMPPIDRRPFSGDFSEGPMPDRFGSARRAGHGPNLVTVASSR